jgi:hypothetical protein
MSLQMYFGMLKRRGFAAVEAYRLARFAATHLTSLYVTLYSNGYDPDAYQVLRPSGEDWMAWRSRKDGRS